MAFCRNAACAGGRQGRLALAEQERGAMPGPANIPAGRASGCTGRMAFMPAVAAGHSSSTLPGGGSACRASPRSAQSQHRLQGPAHNRALGTRLRIIELSQTLPCFPPGPASGPNNSGASVPSVSAAHPCLQAATARHRRLVSLQGRSSRWVGPPLVLPWRAGSPGHRVPPAWQRAPYFGGQPPACPADTRRRPHRPPLLCALQGEPARRL